MPSCQQRLTKWYRRRQGFNADRAWYRPALPRNLVLPRPKQDRPRQTSSARSLFQPKVKRSRLSLWTQCGPNHTAAASSDSGIERGHMARVILKTRWNSAKGVQARQQRAAAYAREVAPIAAAMRAQGWTFLQIADALLERGIFTRRGVPWSASSVWKLLNTAKVG